MQSFCIDLQTLTMIDVSAQLESFYRSYLGKRCSEKMFKISRQRSFCGAKEMDKERRPFLDRFSDSRIMVVLLKINTTFLRRPEWQFRCQRDCYQRGERAFCFHFCVGTSKSMEGSWRIVLSKKVQSPRPAIPLVRQL